MRVYLVSNVTLHREGLAEVLARRDGIEVAGTAGDPAAIPAALADGRTIVVLDMTGFDPSEVATCVARTSPSRVLAVNVPGRERDVVACAEAGMACCLTAEVSLAELVAAIGSVARGEAPCSPRTSAILLRRVATLAQERRLAVALPPVARPYLTTREREIVGLVGSGLSNKEIAHTLCIELPTVKNHVHRILEKLGVRRRAEAAALLRSGAIHDVPRSTSPSPV